MLKNDKITKFILLTSIVVLIVFNWKSCESQKLKKYNYKQNIEALKKELVFEKNKNGELQTSTVAYIGTINELKENNSSLYNEVKKLKNRKPKVIINTEIEYRDTNIVINNNIIDTTGLKDGIYRLSWNYINNDSTRTLEGNSLFTALIYNDGIKIIPKKTTITKDELKLSFIVGVAKNKKTGFDEIFVTPKNEKVKVNKLEGAVLGKSKLGINISMSVGYGLNYLNGNLGLGPFVGVSVSKPIFKF